MEVRIKNPFAFVLMPFKEEFSQAYALIKRTCKDISVECERVDEQSHSDNVMNRIYQQVREADFIIADTTGGNPNVFFEVGYAHARDKTIIHITQDLDDVPFDLKHAPHIPYSIDNEHECQKFSESLKKCLLVQMKRKSSLGDFASSDLPFHILNKKSGKCIDVWHASTEDGVPLLHYALHGDENQLWTLHPTDGGFWRIVSKASGMCITAAEDGDIPGGAVLQRHYMAGNVAQHWSFERAFDGSYRIKNRGSRKCLTIAREDSALIQQECLNDEDQRWWVIITAKVTT